MDLRVEIVRVGKVEKHPNADKLEMTKVFDYPVIMQTGAFKEGDLAVYVPVDSVVPATEAWRWIHEGAVDVQHRRIKAKRLRGIYSEGLLIPATDEYLQRTSDIADHSRWINSLKPGDDVTSAAKIVKYEPPALKSGGGYQKGSTPPGLLQVTVPGMPKYTDINNIRRYPNTFEDGEQVVIHEKIHGANARYGYMPTNRPPIAWWEKALNKVFGWKPRAETRFVVGSHNTFRWKPKSTDKFHGTNIWQKAADENNLEAICTANPGYVLFGEVYGDVQDLKYGKKPGEISFALFDIWDSNAGKFLDYEKLLYFADYNKIPTAPRLYEGPWSINMLEIHRDGRSTLGDHIREGCVIRSAIEKTYIGGRKVLKAVSPDYLTRKGGSESKE